MTCSVISVSVFAVLAYFCMLRFLGVAAFLVCAKSLIVPREIVVLKTSASFVVLTGDTGPVSVKSVCLLTLWRPLSSHSFCTIWVQKLICYFWHPGTLTLSPKRQSTRMSKIASDGLTRSATGCFIAVPISSHNDRCCAVLPYRWRQHACRWRVMLWTDENDRKYVDNCLRCFTVFKLCYRKETVRCDACFSRYFICSLFNFRPRTFTSFSVDYLIGISNVISNPSAQAWLHHATTQTDGRLTIV